MKNLLSLLFGILLFTSCQLEEVGDLSELTQEQRDEIYDQITEPRDVSYLIGTVLDTVTMDSVKALQTVSIIDRSIQNQGAFAYDLALYQCEDKRVDPKAVVFIQRSIQLANESLGTPMTRLHLRDVIGVSIENHLDDWYKVDLTMDTDTIFGGKYYSNCSQTLYSESSAYPTNTVHLYGYTKNEAEFIKAQLDRLIPQLNEN